MTDVQDARAVSPEPGAVQVSGLFRDRYPEMVRLANLLGADDPEDVAQEAFARLIRRAGQLRDLPEREIAAAMGVSPGTVKSYVSRGLDALGEALEGKL